MQLGDARGGGLVEPQKTKPSHWGSVSPSEQQKGSDLGRGDLGGVRKVQLRAIGLVIGLVHRRGAGCTHLVTLPSLSFSYPFPILKSPL